MKQMQSTYTWLKFLYTYVGRVLFKKSQEQINDYTINVRSCAGSLKMLRILSDYWKNIIVRHKTVSFYFIAFYQKP